MNKNQKIISLFTLGVLWGIAEIIFGNLVQNFSLPLRGIILTIISIFFIITTKKFVEFKGSILLLGIIVITLKAFYYQNIFHTALYAVLIQVALAEFGFIFLKNFKKATLTVSSVLLLYTFIHGVIAHGVYMGKHIFVVYQNMLRDLLILDIISKSSYEIILIFFGLIHIVIGFFAGKVLYIVLEKIKPVIDSFIEEQ